MAKKFFSKALSVGLSLALCAGMVMPALAWAPLRDEYIDENGVLQGHDWEDGISYDYYLEDDYVLDQTLVVEDGVQATIDLNGHDLKLNDKSEIIKDDDGYLEDIKVADSSGEVKEGSVIRVDGQGTKLTVYGNKEEKDADYESGEGKGGITGGNNPVKDYDWVHQGGGVNVANSAAFEMFGGSIYGNKATDGGGLFAASQNYDEGGESRVSLTDVDVSENYAEDSGGGINFTTTTDFTMTRGSVSGNTAEQRGGGIEADTGSAKLKDVEVSYNTAEEAGGISVFDGVDFSMEGGSIHHNRTEDADSGTLRTNDEWGIKLNGVAISDNEAEHLLTADLSYYDSDWESSLYLIIDADHTARIHQYRRNDETEEWEPQEVVVEFSFAEDASFEIDDHGEYLDNPLSVKGIESLTVYDAEGNSTTYEFVEGTKAIFNADGTITIENGGVVKEDGKETIYVGGADVDGFDYTGSENNDGEVSIVPKGETITKTDNGDGSVTITGQDGDGEEKFEKEITLPSGKDASDVTVNGEGTTTVPEGGKITDDETETTYPDGAQIDKDGNVTGEGLIITKDKTTGDVTIDDGKGNTTEVTPPTGGEDIGVDPDGTVHVPEGGKIDGTEYPNGATILPDGTIVPNEGDDDDGDNGGTGGGTGSNVFEGYDFGAGTTNIEDEAVPLAGIVFIQDVLAELYRRAGSPDGADAEGEYDRAVAWALANELIDDETDVEAVVTVAALRAILANYAKVFGANAVAAEDLTTLTGEDDDVVMNCDEVLAEFFGEEYVPAKDEEETAA